MTENAIIHPNTSKRDALAVELLDQVAALGDAATPRAVADLYIDIMGSSEDPAMIAVCAALGAMSPSSSSSGSPMMDAAASALEAARFDAAVADAADVRGDLIELASRAIGRDFTSRIDGKPKTDTAIKREIIGKIDPTRLTKIDAYSTPARQAVALDVHLDEARAILDARKNKGPELLAAVLAAREDNRERADALSPAEAEMAARHAARPPQAVLGHTAPR